MATTDQAQKYYESLIATYDVLSDAVTKGGERGVKITTQLAQEISQGQREALELGKKLSGNQKDLGQLYTALVEATTAAQGRSLAFAQFAYQQALEAGTESREHMEKLVEVNRQATQAATDLARLWASENPMTEMFRRSMEAMSPDATKKSAPKAAATS